jgi:hypothetical protein
MSGVPAVADPGRPEKAFTHLSLVNAVLELIAAEA